MYFNYEKLIYVYVVNLRNSHMKWSKIYTNLSYYSKKR